MKLAISNIGWDAESDPAVYALMRKYGFSGLEIAPTRVFPASPYDKTAEAARWAKTLSSKQGFSVPSMQSIWYGRTESIFGTEEERQALTEYTKKAVGFAAALGCRNLVFGCPRSRNMPDGADAGIAAEFFRAIGGCAASAGAVIGLEANPPIYNTNFINDTPSAIELIDRVGSPGLRLNLDVGTMIANGEPVDELRGLTGYVSHVHISEPGLTPIKERKLHYELFELLKSEGYSGYVSIEMGRAESLEALDAAMRYVAEVFK